MPSLDAWFKREQSRCDHVEVLVTTWKPERPPGSLSHNPVIPEKLTEHVVQLLPMLPLLQRTVHPFTDDLIRGLLSAAGAEQGVAGSKCDITDRGSLITLNKGFLGWPAT